MKLNHHNLGTVRKGECAGMIEMPKVFKMIFKMLMQLGERYEQTTTCV